MLDRFKELLGKLKWSTVLVIIVAGAAFSFYSLDQSEIDSREQNIVSTNAEITSLKRKLEEAKEFERQFEEKKKRYAELVREFQKIQGALPRQFYLPDLLADIISEAKQLEIEISVLKPDDHETTAELYNTLGFDIEAKGTFLQFFIFMDRLANMKRIVNVQKLVVEKDTDEKRRNVTLGGTEGAFAGSKLTGGRIVYPGLKANFRLLTYRYREVASAPQAPATSTPAATPAPVKHPNPRGKK